MNWPVTILCTLLPVWLVALPDSLRAPRWSVRAQFAGMQGTLSGGVLWNTPDGRLQAGAMYGFSDARNGVPEFHGLAFRANGSWFPLHRSTMGRWHVSPTLAVTGLLELGDHAFLSLPEHYPDDYYGQHALHALVAVGGRMGRMHRSGRGWAFTVETVALDTYLWYAISQRSTPFTDAWSLALGAEVYF